MKRLGTLLAGMALIVAGGVFVSARADDDRESVTLFTSAIHASGFQEKFSRPFLCPTQKRTRIRSRQTISNLFHRPGALTGTAKFGCQGRGIPMTSEWS